MFDTTRFSAAVREKRGSRSLRSAANEIETHHGKVLLSTLSRLEHGASPDVHTLGIVCAWLGASPADFFTGSSPEPVERHIPGYIGESLHRQAVALAHLWYHCLRLECKRKPQKHILWASGKGDQINSRELFYSGKRIQIIIELVEAEANNA